MICPACCPRNRGRGDFHFLAWFIRFPLLLLILLLPGAAAVGQSAGAGKADHSGISDNDGEANIAGEPSTTSQSEWFFEMTNHLGRWIWDDTTSDNQTVRFWKAVTIPSHPKVVRATMRITADNGYTLFLDGKTIGGGYDWRSLKVYDLTPLLTLGRHVLAVQAHNDHLQAGLIFCLTISFKDNSETIIVSGDDWLITPVTNADWAAEKLDVTVCHPAHVLDTSAYAPAWLANWPYGVVVAPLLQPAQLRFWQRGWFQLTLAMICLAAVGYSIVQMFQLSTQAKARNLLQLERARIARDIHDDLSAQLTQVVLLAEVAQREHPQNSTAFGQLSKICDRVREVAVAMNEVVWAVNSRRDTVSDFVNYVCKYAQLFFSATSIRCRLDVEPVDIPHLPFDLPVRRNLFLAVKEALHNAAKHSQASELFLRIHWFGTRLIVSVEDDGRGFDPESAASERNGMSNMRQRMADIGGTFSVSSQPGAGCLVVFNITLAEERRHWFQHGSRQHAGAESNSH
jgi:signal transduction histidine kinase